TVRGVRGPAARARTGRFAGHVLRTRRRGILANGPGPDGSRVPACRGDPRARAVNAERVNELIAALDRGELRVAEPVNGDWRVNGDAQAAILAYFRRTAAE